MKAELFSSDFVTGLAIFMIAMGIFGVYYINIQNDIESYSVRNDIQTKANTVADLLISTSGQPVHWDASSVEVIGLVDSNIINLTKFEELMKIDYYAAKRMLGIGGYDIYIALKDETGQVLENSSVPYEFGAESDESTLQAFYVERYGLSELDGLVNKTILGVVVWL